MTWAGAAVRGVDKLWVAQFRDVWRTMLGGSAARRSEIIGCDAQGGVVVEAAPTAAFEVSKLDFLLELLIARSMRQRSFAASTRSG